MDFSISSHFSFWDGSCMSTHVLITEIKCNLKADFTFTSMLSRPVKTVSLHFAFRTNVAESVPFDTCCIHIRSFQKRCTSAVRWASIIHFSLFNFIDVCNSSR